MVFINCLILVILVQDYSLTVTPPALLIPYRLPLATDTKKQVKVSFCITDVLLAVGLIFLMMTPLSWLSFIQLSNRSLAAVYYQWSKYECATVSITVDPPYGHIGTYSSWFCTLCSNARVL